MPWTAPTTRSTGFGIDAARWNGDVVDNMNFIREVNYTPFTSPVSITATTEATSQAVVTSGAITYEAVPTLLEFWCSSATAPAGSNLRIGFFDVTTQLGLIMSLTASATTFGVMGALRLTPTAASHTYNVRAYLAAAGTGTINAGLGGTGNTTLLPGFIRITRIPT